MLRLTSRAYTIAAAALCLLSLALLVDFDSTVGLWRVAELFGSFGSGYLSLLCVVYAVEPRNADSRESVLPLSDSSN